MILRSQGIIDEGGEQYRDYKFSIKPLSEYIGQEYQSPVSHSNSNILQPSFLPLTSAVFSFGVIAGPC